MDMTLDTKMANDLPIVHRNPFLLATLNPAVVVRSTTEQSPYHHWAANQLDVGGGTSTKNDILVDGVPQLVGAKAQRGWNHLRADEERNERLARNCVLLRPQPRPERDCRSHNPASEHGSQ
jgi:hypothetical protein